MSNEIKARLWDGTSDRTLRYSKKKIGSYYCSGEAKVRDQDIAFNLPDGTQLVVNTMSVIACLRKHNRI